VAHSNGRDFGCNVSQMCEVCWLITMGEILVRIWMNWEGVIMWPTQMCDIRQSGGVIKWPTKKGGCNVGQLCEVCMWPTIVGGILGAIWVNWMGCLSWPSKLVRFGCHFGQSSGAIQCPSQISYESLNANFRLVLLTRVSKNFYHPNVSTGTVLLLTTRLIFVVHISKK